MIHAQLLSIALLLTAGSAPTTENQFSRLVASSGALHVGGEMIPFAGWTLGGELWSLERYRKRHPGRPLVVSFFATWCQPCVRSLPVLEKIRASAGPADTEVVLVAYGQEEDVVGPFVERLGLGAPIILDPFAKIAARFGVDKSLPRTFVIGADSTVSAIFETEGSDFEELLRARLHKAQRPRQAP